MIAVNVTHSIKPVEVEGKIYALKKGDSAFLPSKLAGAMIKRGWAAKMPNLKKIPVAAIKINIDDIASVATINKGKRVAEKYDYVAFYYSGKKVMVYAIHEDYNQKTIAKLNELEAIEGEGEGIAIYRLEHITKLLKGAKKGIIRIEEDVPLKVSVKIGRDSKAVAFLTPVADEDLRAMVAEEAGIVHKEEAGEDNSAVEAAIEKEAEKLRNEIEEEKTGIINETAPKVGWTIIKEGIVENSQTIGYKRGVKLEQNDGFFRITIDGYFPHGYTTESEAVKRYEWLTEVR